MLPNMEYDPSNLGIFVMSIFCDILHIIELSLYNSIIFLSYAKFLIFSFFHRNYQDTILN
jgi:hypothetical protein